MTRNLTAIALTAFFFHQCHSLAFAQSPAFEVASITPCQPGTAAPPMEHAGIADFITPGGRFTARATTLQFLLEWAYGIQPAQHSGGPSWIGDDRFDVVAKAEGKASDDEIKAMVRTLLADRFPLQLHHEPKEISAYVISTGKAAPKLFPPKPDEIHGIHIAQETGPGQKRNTFRVIAMRYSLAQLADTFARQLGSVIVNKTGLDGEFDFSFDLTPDDSHPSPGDPILMIAAMREQLGLTVKYEKTVVEFYHIDGAEKAAGN